VNTWCLQSFARMIWSRNLPLQDRGEMISWWTVMTPWVKMCRILVEHNIFMCRLSVDRLNRGVQGLHWPLHKVVMFGIKPKLMKCRFELTYFDYPLTYLKTIGHVVPPPWAPGRNSKSPDENPWLFEWMCVGLGKFTIESGIVLTKIRWIKSFSCDIPP
jgi:hypothetical protein